MKKIEVEITYTDGELERYNPVETISLDIKNDYMYDFEAKDIKEIRIYPVKQPKERIKRRDK